MAKWKSEVGKDERQSQDSGPGQGDRDISVEARLLNTDKFLEKHLMDNLMRCVKCDCEIVILI